ncbi:MAG: choice-of-anchor D domain-containing protein, partial [Planctomycetes bacterium]|nr:choice-of-anchor D domain-containing protein [Planctomycetota bacterium]
MRKRNLLGFLWTAFRSGRNAPALGTSTRLRRTVDFRRARVEGLEERRLLSIGGAGVEQDWLADESALIDTHTVGIDAAGPVLGPPVSLLSAQDCVLQEEVIPGWVMLREHSEPISVDLSQDLSLGPPLGLGAPPTISLKKGPNLLANSAASAAFDEAAAILEDFFDDSVTIVVDAELASMGGSILGGTSSVAFADTYTTVRDLMVADRDVTDEAIVASLPTSGGFSAMLPGGWIFDGNIRANRANLLALGVSPGLLTAGPDSAYDPGVKRDMDITFNSDFTWDYDRSDGIGFGLYDFVGVAVHEMMHGLGFVSFVDVVDYNLYLGGGPYAVPVNPLDLFRLQPGDGASNFTSSARVLVPGSMVANQVTYDGGVHDFTAAGYSGLTVGDIPMATGAYYGDGGQASHFKDNEVLPSYLSIGIMDPTIFSSGVQSEVQSPDIRALGLIGWDVADPPQTTILETDFTGGPPAGWSIDDFLSDGKTWTQTNPGPRRNPLSGTFMTVDSFWVGSVNMDESLRTPSINCSSYENVTLGFTHYFRDYSTEKADVDVRVGGGSWQNVARYQGAEASGNVSLDISSIADGQSNVEIRWHYWDAYYEWWWQVDNVRVSGDPVAAAPDIDVQGNSLSIVDGDITPSAADHTDFGGVALAGATLTRTFTIENTGTATLNLTGGSPVTITGTGDFTVTSQPALLSLNPSQSTTFDVQFDPSAVGVRSATVNVASNDADENPYDYAIQGTGIQQDIDVQGNGQSIVDGDATPTTADHTDFSSVALVGATLTRTFTIENTGTDTLVLTGGSPVTITGTHAGDFTVTSQPALLSLTAGQTTTFDVQIDPSALGLRSATVNVASNDPDENPYDYAIQGTGVEQDIDVQGNGQSIVDGDAT